jgi:hypothetical protein
LRSLSFDNNGLVNPSCGTIALYGNEIWGILRMSEKQKQNQKSMIFTDWECEKLNIKFCKYILGVNKKTTNLRQFFTCILNFFSPQFLTTDKSICNLLTRAIIVENQDTKWSSYIFLHSS